ncbi:hypothetical protein D3C87_1461130 [compost metagenome]
MMQGAQPAQVLFRRQQILDPGRVADPQQVARQLTALFVQRLAVEQHLTGGRLHQPREQAQQAGLAAAVGAADLHHFATGQSQIEIFEEQPKVSLTGKGNGLQDRTGQGFTGLIRFKSALARPLKRCRINVLAAQTSELRQIIAMLSALCIQLGGIIHASSYSQECIFPRL